MEFGFSREQLEAQFVPSEVQPESLRWSEIQWGKVEKNEERSHSIRRGAIAFVQGPHSVSPDGKIISEFWFRDRNGDLFDSEASKHFLEIDVLGLDGDPMPDLSSGMVLAVPAVRGIYLAARYGLWPMCKSIFQSGVDVFLPEVGAVRDARGLARLGKALIQKCSRWGTGPILRLDLSDVKVPVQKTAPMALLPKRDLHFAPGFARMENNGTTRVARAISTSNGSAHEFTESFSGTPMARAGDGVVASPAVFRSKGKGAIMFFSETADTTDELLTLPSGSGLRGVIRRFVIRTGSSKAPSGKFTLEAVIEDDVGERLLQRDNGPLERILRDRN